MLGAGKAIQVSAYPGQEDFPPPPADARHGIKQLYGSLFLLELQRDFIADPRHRLLKVVEMIQLLTNQEGGV